MIQGRAEVVGVLKPGVIPKSPLSWSSACPLEPERPQGAVWAVVEKGGTTALSLITSLARVPVLGPVEGDEVGSPCLHSGTRWAARGDILWVVVIVLLAVGLVVVTGGKTTCKGEGARCISDGGILEGSW